MAFGAVSGFGRPGAADMHLDMPTALLFTAMVSLVNAAAMSLLALRDRSLYLRDWAISFALIVVGVAIIGLHGSVPPLASSNLPQMKYDSPIAA